MDGDNFQRHRRSLLRATLGGMVSLAAAPVMAAPGGSFAARRRSLSFRHLHTGEALSVTYWAGGRYDVVALSQVDHLLRDFRNDEQIRMDVVLLDFLHRLRSVLDTDQPFEIISGYRSPETNARLAAQSSNVSKRSYHMQGKAIDVRLPGRQLSDVRRAALKLRFGGVGFYPGPKFVHLDTGRVRSW